MTSILLPTGPGRSIGHLARLFWLADEAGLIQDGDLAVARMLPVPAASGIDGRARG